jgi:hypothetical protein
MLLPNSLALTLAAVTIATAPLPAPPQSDNSTIVVTGRANTAQDRKNYVRALTALSFGGQIARFEHRVCPVAIGLPPVQAEALVARLRKIARAIGIDVAPKGCPANVLVAVTADKKAFINELRRHHDGYFGGLSQPEIREIAKQPGPATAWQLRGSPISARGTDLAFDDQNGYYVNQTTESASRITAAARLQFDGAVVVVERGTLEGLTVTQLADYAAMRAFAAIDVKRLATTATPTILTVLEAPLDSEVAGSLTSWDFAFLRSLYTVPRSLQPDAQRSAIRSKVEAEVGRQRN